MESKTIKIGFDGRPLIEEEIRGFSRYTFELIKSLGEISNGLLAFYSFSPEPINPVFQRALNLNQVVFKARREILWEQFELPRQLKKHRIGIFHATANRGLPLWRVCKYLLTRHDIIENKPEFSESTPFKSLLRRKYADYVSIRSADAILTVSEHSKKDICNYWGVSEGKVIVTYEAANEGFYVKASNEQIEFTKNKYNLPREYLLYLGGFDKKKNIPALLKGYGLVSGKLPALVLAGEKKWGFPMVEQMVQKLGISEKIVFPGRIDDHDLPPLYQGAMAFLYPSLYEGFGLQLVEAMASGIPVIASSKTSLPEVLNGAGLLFNPQDPKTIAEQMVKVVSDRVLHERLCWNSTERAKSFSWQKTAEETLSVYIKALGET